MPFDGCVRCQGYNAAKTKKDTGNFIFLPEAEGRRKGSGILGSFLKAIKKKKKKKKRKRPQLLLPVVLSLDFNCATLK
jgi:hypothetical protein